MLLDEQCSAIDQVIFSSYSFTMRLAFAVLVLFVCYAAVNATADLASSLYDLPYSFDPYHDSNPQAFRTVGMNLGGFNIAFPRATNTGVRILTSTFTCTLSVSNRCGVRATVARPGKVRVSRPGRPAVSAVTTAQPLVVRDNMEDDVEEQFPIDPSAVQGVEATALPTRDARVADPQRFVISPAFRYQPQDIQSAFESDPYESAMSLPFHRRYALPGQQRQMPMPAFIQSLLVSTTMTTSFKIATFTFTPSCSVAGKIPQCPNGK